MRPNYDIREVYVGNNVLANYTFDFKVSNLAHLKVIMLDELGVVVFDVRATDSTYFTTTLNEDGVGGTITYAVPPSFNYTIIILLADDQPVQPANYGTDNKYTMKKIEQSFDSVVGQVQRMRYLLDRSLRIPDKIVSNFKAELDTVFPEGVVVVSPDGLKFTLVPRTELMGADGEPGANPGFTIDVGAPDNADGIDFDLYYDSVSFTLYQKLAGVWEVVGIIGGGVPGGGVQGSALEKMSDDDGDVQWLPHTYQGISRFGAWDSTGLADTIQKILNIQYTPPTISLSGSSNVLREKGTSVSGITLTATITKMSDAISQVQFFRNPSTLLDTQLAGGAIPNGGANTFVYPTPFSDNVTFRAQVTDDGDTGGPTTVQATTTYSFVYPMFDGANASAALTAAQVATLTKRIENTSNNITRVFTASAGNTLYFAQPSSYTPLSVIFDVNNFDVTASWSVSTGTYTALDGSTQTLRVYKLNNPVAAGSYTFRFTR